MEAAGDRRDVILVVDDDEDIARFVEFNLRLHGFDVMLASDGQEALELIERQRPDLAVVDLMMPRIDGLELTRRLRADPMTAVLPVIMLTAKGMTQDKVNGLSAGADDYLVKPFDTLELLARVTSTLRRNKEFREVSPLTGLPGNSRIRREIADRVRSGTDYAVGYIDIDRFKSVNDRYGFVRGDDFIAALARTLHQAVVSVAPPPAFLGHVGGDDFVFVCTPDQVLALTSRVSADFEKAADALYDPTDRERGYVELKDRRGNMRKAALVTLSIGVCVSDADKRLTSPLEAMTIASEMKSVAKSQPGSYVAVDRRRGVSDPNQRHVK
ncbi:MULTISPECIES: response regulator [Micromonospora]|uniref:Diguanylate cyclase response regulator n=3 Tax=Micromonospora TaxID=1873 RepID=A0A9X0I9C5_9ACTN|nr:MULTISPECIES: response regulator [Micromonospora]AEB44130.1 response regulator receiver modulated diguanylate cyclase [Micromonospora maris AB-18-032]KUJ49343.1 diguanylate cyclase response regulator [Micromonospora maris]MBL6279956.1 response regulator [Micromonospora fiedleri]PMR60245.1 diguanylate cyclase response regulator [Verrucosispora sp. ts21]RUL91211.1 response regulator [Verrucosispora sp. FIM060022]